MYCHPNRVSVYGSAWVKGVHGNRRYEFYGNGRELQEAVIQALGLPPKRRFVTVFAEEFLEESYKYGKEGYWTDYEVES